MVKKRLIILFALLFFSFLILGCTQQQISEKEEKKLEKEKPIEREITLEQLVAMKRKDFNENEMIKCEMNSTAQGMQISFKVFMHVDDKKKTTTLKTISTLPFGISAGEIITKSVENDTLTYVSKDFALLMGLDKEEIKDCNHVTLTPSVAKMIGGKTYNLNNEDEWKASLNEFITTAKRDNMKVKCLITKADMAIFDIRGKICEGDKLFEKLLNKTTINKSE